MMRCSKGSQWRHATLMPRGHVVVDQEHGSAWRRHFAPIAMAWCSTLAARPVWNCKSNRLMTKAWTRLAVVFSQKNASHSFQTSMYMYKSTYCQVLLAWGRYHTVHNVVRQRDVTVTINYSHCMTNYVMTQRITQWSAITSQHDLWIWFIYIHVITITTDLSPHWRMDPGLQRPVLHGGHPSKY